MQLADVSFRIGNLELRSCDENLLRVKIFTTLEIVYWENKGHCWVVAHWEEGNSGEYSLVFCVGRPFNDYIDREVFWDLAYSGQKALEGGRYLEPAPETEE